MSNDFYAACPHCDRYEFPCEDAWFEHASSCLQEQEEAQGRDEEE
ncbi:hypothetical protein QSV36_03665 [Pseudomonas sp. BCRC 81390]|nr:hypothetical protein [Pseudomonas sp. BCRC 81390]MDM3884696.1 hypothetical protein [Pseudomonas sp. BCRC 81390]